MGLAVVPPEPEGSGGTPLHQDPGPLLRRSAQGDQEAFASLYDLMAPRVFGLVRRVVRDHAIAEEVTQEVFVEIWRLSARFDETRGSAAGWMLAIAHRRAVDRVRSEEASARRSTTFAETGTTPDHDQTVERAEEHLDGQRVRKALGSLTTPQRRSIELAYYGGYTHTEVAALLDIPVGTAKTRIRDGLIRLRDTLGGQP